MESYSWISNKIILDGAIGVFYNVNGGRKTGCQHAEE
jgi:hypothetical protein